MMDDSFLSLYDRLRSWRRAKPDAAAYTQMRVGADGQASFDALTWEALDLRVAALARRLVTVCKRQDRAVLALPQSLEYPIAFFACLRAGLVAVPLSTTDTPNHRERLHGVVADCEPAIVLTTSDHLKDVQDLCTPVPGVAVLAVDEAQDAVTLPTPAEAVGPDEIAYLQYTSGSTSVPAGVVVTHGALERNLEQIRERFGPHERCTAVSWLPFFHDMGLLNGLLVPVYVGCSAVFMDPLLFLQVPVIWLRALSQFPHAYSAAPNFAFDLCLRRSRKEDIQGLDFSKVHGVVVGSEPINAEAMKAIESALAPLGWRADALMPSYGLAENVVLVSGDRGVRVHYVDAAALGRDAVVSVAEGSGGLMLVGCGRPVEGLILRIVDPAHRSVVPEGGVGEIWCYDPQAPNHYWNDAGRDDDTFTGELSDSGDDPRGPWLRTGDLGALIGGEVVVTGRLKDLIIIDGVNHYPSDIERTVTRCSDVLRPGRIVAFAEFDGAGTPEEVVIVSETRAGREVPESLESDIRETVLRNHQVPVRDVVFVGAGRLPLTTSGKVQRQATRTAYREGRLVRENGR